LLAVAVVQLELACRARPEKKYVAGLLAPQTAGGAAASSGPRRTPLKPLATRLLPIAVPVLSKGCAFLVTFCPHEIRSAT